MLIGMLLIGIGVGADLRAMPSHHHEAHGAAAAVPESHLPAKTDRQHGHMHDHADPTEQDHADDCHSLACSTSAMAFADALFSIAEPERTICIAYPGFAWDRPIPPFDPPPKTRA